MNETLGRLAYEAYGEAGDWHTFDGRNMPRWDDLSASPGGRETQRRWSVAADAVATKVATGA